MASVQGLKNRDQAKKAAGRAAADLIQDSMRIGLGTGSTAFYYIERLIERCREGLKISAAATSEASRKQALEGGIPLLDLDSLTSLDITVDGADEIDQQKRMIKGGGGALLREKIIASISKELIITVDETKIVKNLGHFPLPIEIIPFANAATANRLQKMGYQVQWRNKDGKRYVTDNGNYILDIRLSDPCLEPEKEHERIRSVCGVVETGFFFNLAGRVLIGQSDGQVKFW